MEERNRGSNTGTTTESTVAIFCDNISRDLVRINHRLHQRNLVVGNHIRWFNWHLNNSVARTVSEINALQEAYGGDR